MWEITGRLGFTTATAAPMWQGLNSPLNFFYLCHDLPEGLFSAVTVQARIGREDFQNGNAQFVFIPLADLKEAVVNG